LPEVPEQLPVDASVKFVVSEIVTALAKDTGLLAVSVKPPPVQVLVLPTVVVGQTGKEETENCPAVWAEKQGFPLPVEEVLPT
jgi:hypothetical protein